MIDNTQGKGVWPNYCTRASRPSFKDVYSSHRAENTAGSGCGMNPRAGTGLNRSCGSWNCSSWGFWGIRAMKGWSRQMGERLRGRASTARGWGGEKGEDRGGKGKRKEGGNGRRERKGRKKGSGGGKGETNSTTQPCSPVAERDHTSEHIPGTGAARRVKQTPTRC